MQYTGYLYDSTQSIHGVGSIMFSCCPSLCACVLMRMGACSGGSFSDRFNQSINQSCIFRLVQVTKSLQDPLKVGNNLAGINDNVKERGLEQKCF